MASKGVQCLAGIDEAGRGPLAGPVVAVAACLPIEWQCEGLPSSLCDIHDSKKLSPKKRCDLYERMIEHPKIRFGMGLIESDEIDRINILNATHRAMDLAAKGITDPVLDHALVD